MTMIHIARSFEVSLSIQHPDIDPNEITLATGLKPQWAWRVGDLRNPLVLNPAQRVYCKQSSWSHSFHVEGVLELGEVLEELVEQFQVQEPFFDRIVREGGEVELFCGIYAAGNWDESFPHTLLGRLAALHVDLRLDVYPQKA